MKYSYEKWKHIQNKNTINPEKEVDGKSSAGKGLQGDGSQRGMRNCGNNHFYDFPPCRILTWQHLERKNLLHRIVFLETPALKSVCCEEVPFDSFKKGKRWRISPLSHVQAQFNQIFEAFAVMAEPFWGLNSSARDSGLWRRHRGKEDAAWWR